jgi:hypothetical protein
MSTKIYSGFKFCSTDMRQILADMAGVTDKIKALQNQRYHEAYARLLVNLLDRSTLAREADKPVAMKEGYPTFKVDRWLHKRIREAKASMERDPFYDLEAGMTCWYSEVVDAYIGFTRGEFADKILDILMRAKVAVSYGYWNNTDPEEGVSDEEWAQRKKAWKTVLDKRSRANFQFNFDFEHIWPDPTWAELVPFIPSLEQRAEQHAGSTTFVAWCQALNEEVDESNAWRLLRECKKACKDDPTWQQYFAKETEFVRKLLMSNEELALRCKEKQLLVSLEED